MRKFFKYLTYTLLFMVMSIGSAYGAITISMNNASNLQNSLNKPEPLPKQITNIYENITNTNAMKINLSANLASDTDNYIIDVELDMDTSQGFENLALDGTLKIASNTERTIYDIDFSYQQGKAYIEMFNNKMVIDTTTIIDPLTSILNILNIQIPSLGEMDMSALTPEMIMGMLTNFTEEKDRKNDKITLIIDVPVVGKLNLVCDLKYNIKELSLPTIELEGSEITFSSNISYPESVNISKKVESEYLKVGNLLTVAESILDTMSKENLAFNFNFEFENQAIEGNLYADLKNLSSMATIDLLGKEIKFIAIDNIIYIEYENLFASFALSDFEKINQILKNQFNINVPLDTITEILESLKNGNFDEIMKKFDLTLNLSEIDFSVLESIEVKGNHTTISIRDIGDFGIALDDNKDLKSLAFSGQDITAVLQIAEYKEFSLSTGKQNYIDLAKLLPTAENTIAILKNQTLSGEINFAIGNLEIPIVYEISNKDKDDIFANVEMDILGAKLTINYLNDKLYISFADQALVVIDTTTLLLDINNFLAELELNLDIELLTQMVGILTSLLPNSSPIFTGLEETEKGFILTTSSGFDIIVSNSTNEIIFTFENQNVSLTANIIGSDAEVEKAIVNDEEFAPFKDLLQLGKAFVKAGLIDVTKGFLTLLKEGNCAFNFNANFKETSLNGQIALDIKNTALKLSLDINNEKLNILVINKTIYFEHGNMFAKFTINDLPKLEKLLKEYFNIEIPFEKILQLIESLESENPLAILAKLGISFSLADIDIEFLNSIKQEENTTIIPVESVGEIKLTLADESISVIEFSGAETNAKLNFESFEEIKLSTNKEHYIDIFKFLPTVENAIDIVRSETISGQIDVSIDQTQLVIEYVVDKTSANDIYASFETELLGAKISAVYLNNKVYINMADSFKLAVNVTTLPEAISEFLTAINIETNNEDSINQIVNMIASVIYNDSTPLLITSLTEIENGLEITVYNGLTLSIVNGSKQLSLNANFDNISISATLIGGNLIIDRPSIDEAQYNQFESVLDLAEKFINAGLINIVEGAINYLTKGNIGLTFNATYNNNTFIGALNLDISNKSMQLTAQVDNMDLNILFVDNVIYIEIGNIYAKFAINDIAKVENILANFGINLPLAEIVEKYESIQTSDTPLAELAGLGFNLDLSVIDLAFFDNITVDGNVTTIPFDNNEVKVTITDKVLSNIEFTGNGINANVNFVDFSEFNLSASEDSYIDIVKFLPTVENAIDIVRSETISGQIDVSIDQTQLVIDYVVDKTSANDIYASFETELLGAKISAIYLNNKLYINMADSFKLTVNVTTLPEAISEFLTAINIETSNEDSINQIVNMIASVIYNDSTPLLITSLAEIENGLEITVYNGLTLSIVNESKQLTLNGNYDNVNISATLIGGNLTIDRPSIDESQYNQFESVLDLAEKFINAGLIDVVEGIYNYFKNGMTIGLNFTAQYGEIPVSGTINLNLDKKEIKVSVVYSDIAFNVIVIDKIAYLEIGNIYAKFAVSDLDKIETLIRDNFGLDIPLSKVVEMFEETSKSDTPLASLANLGIIDLSVIDLAFFDNITVNGNVTTIPVDNNEIKVTITDKVLSNVAFTGYGIQASVNFVDFSEFNLSVSKDSYLDLVKVLPTIENAISIIQSNTISGYIYVEGYTINYTVNKNDTSNIYAEFTTNIQGANVKLMYLNNKVYIEFAESIKLVADFDTLPQTINNLLEKADVAFEINDNFDINSMLTSLLGAINPANIPVLITGLTEGTNGSLIITLHDETIITISNLEQEIDFSTTASGIAVSGVIIGDSTASTIPTIDDNSYIPLTDILDLVEAFLNMAKLNDFHISGTFDIIGTIAGVEIDWNVPYDLKIKVVDGEIQAMFVMGAIPVVPVVNNDVPFITGDTNGGKNRYLTIYVKGNDVYIYRSEDVNILFGMDTRHYEKCTKLTIGAFLADPLRYVKYAIGFTDTIMDAISSSILKAINRENPINLNNVVRSLKVKTKSSFEIVLNAAELANNTDMGDITLNIGIAHDGNGDSYLSTLGFNMNMPLASIFQLDLATSDTVIVNYGSPVDMTAFYNYVNNYPYAYDAEWEANNGAWTKASETIYTISFEENGGNEVNNISKAYGAEINLPILQPIESDNGIAKVVKTFAGWYTTSTFDEGTQFTQTTMPRGDKTLYAKWNEEIKYYQTINFVTNSSETVSSITALEGNEIILPSLNLKEIETETAITIYSFAGWYKDIELTQEFIDYIMPSESITLYAKWEVADITEANLLEIYDNDQIIYSRYILSGRAIDLSKIGKVNASTKFYLASNYTTLYEGDFIMPEENLTLHIRNQYTLTIVSEYGNTLNTQATYWQGASISIPSQATIVDDDYSTRQITYTFNGYKVNGVIATVPSVMPNSNTSIEASWTVTKKSYYTVSFVTQWTKPDEWMDNNSSFSGKITCKDAPDAIASRKVLEGTYFDPSVYTTTAKYSYQAVWVSANYNFKILAWNTKGVVNISNGATNGKYDKITSYLITDNVTFYPTWGVY